MALNPLNSSNLEPLALSGLNSCPISYFVFSFSCWFIALFCAVLCVIIAVLNFICECLSHRNKNYSITNFHSNQYGDHYNDDDDNNYK